MDRSEFVEKMNGKVKLIRAEYDYTQEQMASVLGISKKTLVEIEKGRSSLGWTGAVAMCAIFSDSEVLGDSLGGEATDMIHALAFERGEPAAAKTLGGKIWWRTVEEYNHCRIQQNIISHHYRALNEEGGRICAAFDMKRIKKVLDNQ